MEPDNTTIKYAKIYGLLAIIGALCWTAGDILIVGYNASPDNYPFFKSDYAGLVDAEIAMKMLPASTSRLMLGALVAVFSIPLFFAGAIHVYKGLKPGNRILARLTFILLIVGYAYSPLAHASFFFLGEAYKTILQVDKPSQMQLIAMAAGFHKVLLITWLAAIITTTLGWCIFIIAVAKGGTAFPRWLAIANPVVLVIASSFLTGFLPKFASDVLDGAGINIGCTLFYILSTLTIFSKQKIVS